MNKFCITRCRIVAYRRIVTFLRMVYRRVVSNLNWPVYYQWVMGHMGHGSKP